MRSISIRPFDQTLTDREYKRAQQNEEECLQTREREQKVLEAAAKPFIEASTGSHSAKTSGLLSREGNLTKLLRLDEMDVDEDTNSSNHVHSSRQKVIRLYLNKTSGLAAPATSRHTRLLLCGQR